MSQKNTPKILTESEIEDYLLEYWLENEREERELNNNIIERGYKTEMDMQTEILMNDIIEMTSTEIKSLNNLTEIMKDISCDEIFKNKLSSQINDELYGLYQVKEQTITDLEQIQLREGQW